MIAATKQYVAVRAVIVKDGKILLIRESQKYASGTNKGKYDFPGGKLKAGESLIDAIVREVSEEVGLQVKIGNPFYAGEWSPVVAGEVSHIVGIFFLCEALSARVMLSDDHDEYLWITPKDAQNLALIDENANAIEVLLEQKLV